MFFKHKHGDKLSTIKKRIIDTLFEHNFCDDSYNEINVCKCGCGWFAFFVDDNNEENDIVRN